MAKSTTNPPAHQDPEDLADLDDSIEEEDPSEWNKITAPRTPLGEARRLLNGDLVDGDNADGNLIDEQIIAALTTPKDGEGLDGKKGPRLSQPGSQFRATSNGPRIVDPDARLRPRKLDDIVGQPLVKDILRRSIRAATRRGEVLDHVLFAAPPGLGKTTFAQTIAFEMGHQMIQFTGPTIDAPTLSLIAAKIINASSEGESCIVFIDEIHGLPKETRDIILTFMEDFMLGDIELPPFTVVGATTESNKLSVPMLHRFGLDLQLDFYDHSDIMTILIRSFRILMGRSEESMAALTASGSAGYQAIDIIADRSRGIPRIANRLVRRVLDFMLDLDSDSDDIAYTDASLEPTAVHTAMKALRIDAAGLTQKDREILVAMRQRYKLRPVGVLAIATAIGETQQVVEKVLEPDLIRMGYINREQRGRQLTAKGILAAEIEMEGETEF